LINLFAAGIWHFIPPGAIRWLVSAILIAVPYLLLGRGLMQSNKLEKRIYRFAD
jgi:NADH-quinone oxidoreductase subunit H